MCSGSYRLVPELTAPSMHCRRTKSLRGRRAAHAHRETRQLRLLWVVVGPSGSSRCLLRFFFWPAIGKTVLGWWALILPCLTFALSGRCLICFLPGLGIAALLLLPATIQIQIRISHLNPLLLFPPGEFLFSLFYGSQGCRLAPPGITSRNTSSGSTRRQSITTWRWMESVLCSWSS